MIAAHYCPRNENGGSFAEMPLWAVTGHRLNPECGFIGTIRLNVAAPSRLTALAVVRRDDPFWDNARVTIEQHEEMAFGPTAGAFDNVDYYGWRFA